MILIENLNFFECKILENKIYIVLIIMKNNLHFQLDPLEYFKRKQS